MDRGGLVSGLVAAPAVRDGAAHANPSAQEGRNRFRFTARLAGRALPVGRYRLTVVATDAAGNRAVAPARAFRIQTAR